MPFETLFECRNFLKKKALRAHDTILASLNSLIDFPEANRPVSEVPGHGELVIKLVLPVMSHAITTLLEVMLLCFL